MANWLFQGNSDHFAIDEYLAERTDVLWSVRQAHLAEDMSLGDEVFFWRARGSQGRSEPGVIGQGEIVGRPRVQVDDAPELWANSQKAGPKLRVKIRLLRRNLGLREVVKEAWLEEDPVLAGHRIFQFRQQTNYRLTGPQADRLEKLLKNTGRDWSFEESLAGLWAYKATLGASVSRHADGPVTEVALRIGRAVGGVYNKVMNFRSLDPRDSRAGLTGYGEVDEAVWTKYFDQERQKLDGEAIDRDFGRLWGKAVNGARPYYKGFGSAPSDDPEELDLFARRVRRGQPAFRARLLELYGQRCAISGWGPEEVLEAAHLTQHSESGVNDPNNGLLLRSDIHLLLDRGLIRVEPKTLRVVADDSLRDTPYSDLDGRTLRARTDRGRPAEKYLQARWKT